MHYGHPRTPRLAVVFLTSLLATGAPAAYLDSNLAVTPAAQANGGGCYPVSIAPGLLDMLTLVNPEWAPVDPGLNLPPFSDPVTFHGTVALAKVNETGDFPASHLFYDQNTFITVDAADMGLVATGNVSPEGVEAGTLEVENEWGLYPLFAWGGTGDRMTAVGRWIWDCGHPNPDPTGTCSVTTSQACVINSDCHAPLCPTCVAGETCQNVNFNFHSELHPPQALAVSRVGHGYRFSTKVKGGHLATKTDVWISAHTGGAGDACPTTHQANLGVLLGIDCFPFSQPLLDVNTSNFQFDIPLPPRPAGNNRPPRIKVIDRTPPGLPRPPVFATFVDGPTPVVHATVDMVDPVGGVLPSDVGKTIIAGWRHDPTPVTKLRVLVTAIEILNPLKAVQPALPLFQRCSLTTGQDCSASACPAGETCLSLGGPTPGWQMFLEVNGEWKQLTGLGAVNAPGVIPQTLKFDVALPAGDTLHLHTTGKSLACLESQLYGRSLGGDLLLYGLTNGAICLADQSHNPGAIDVAYGGPDFGSGGGRTDYETTVSNGDGGSCSFTTSQFCVVNGDCPLGETCVEAGGSYRLDYTIIKR